MDNKKALSESTRTGYIGIGTGGKPTVCIKQGAQNLGHNMPEQSEDAGDEIVLQQRCIDLHPIHAQDEVDRHSKLSVVSSVHALFLQLDAGILTHCDVSKNRQENVVLNILRVSGHSFNYASIQLVLKM
jgi:hypothetical protein